MKPPSDAGLAARIKDALSAMAQDLRRPGGPADLSPMIDRAVQSISESVHKWNHGSEIRRFLGGPGHDELARRGEWAQLAVQLGPVAQLGAERARFFLDEEQVGEVPTDGRDHVDCCFIADRPGLFSVQVELLRKSGAIVSPRGTTGISHLQVIDEAAVVGVDADLLLSRSASELSVLRRGSAAGLELVYFDLATSDRSAEIRQAISDKDLPPGAVLVYPLDASEPGTVGADFREVFAVTSLRLLRAAGVPFVGLLVPGDTDYTQVERQGLITRTLGDWQVELEKPRPFAEEQDQQAAFDARRKASSSMTFHLDEATGTQALEGNRTSFEFDNHRARERLFELIRDARSSVHLQVYMLQPSEFSERLVVELIRSARKGARIRVIVDALYSGERALGRSNPLVRSLQREPNVSVVAGSPIEHRAQVETVTLKKRDHRKLVIVDGKTALVSGRNAGDEYYRGFDEVPIHDETPHERIPWLDAHVEIHGPLVSEVQRCFLSAWEDYAGPPPKAEEVLLPAIERRVGTNWARFVVHNGLRDANGMAQYTAMLDAAADHVYIVNNFPIVASLASALSRAVARGVRVCLLTGNGVPRRSDGTFFPGPLHRELFEYMVKHRLEPLMKKGVEVYELALSSPNNVARGGVVRPYVHAKILTADARAVSVGSANLDATASYWEHEANIVVEDADFAEGVEAEIQRLIDGSYRIDPDSEYWSREGAQRAIVAKLWPERVYS